MIEEDVRKNFITTYSQLFYEVIMNAIETGENGKLFHDCTLKRQSEIGAEAGRRARSLAIEFVQQLEAKGWLDRKPSQEELGGSYVDFVRRLRENRRS